MVSYRRIYEDRIKKYLTKTGVVGVSLIFGLFMLLSAQGDITITGFSGDQQCAGTEYDPCYAYLNFTAETNIYIYPTNETTWMFNVTPMNSMERIVMQRSWGDYWRTINLSKTYTTKTKYAVKFSKGNDYQLRFIGYKTNINETVKWGFGFANGNYSENTDTYVDPEWSGYTKDSFFTELTKVKVGFTKGYAEFVITNPLNKEIEINKSNLKSLYTLVQGEVLSEQYTFYEHIEEKTIKVDKTTCVDNLVLKPISVINNITGLNETDVIGVIEQDCETVKVDEIVSAKKEKKQLGVVIPKNGNLTFRIDLTYKPNTIFDWIPEYEIDGIKFKQINWTWFNMTFDKRQPITIEGIGLDIPDDYQYLLNIDYDADMQNDFADLRFTWFNTTDSEEYEIDYWVESQNDGVNVTLWAEVPIIYNETTNTTLYMYYSNNTGVSSESNASATLGDGIDHFYPIRNNANDMINNDNGTAYGSILTTDRNSISNEAYYFDGDNDYITFSTITNYPTPTFTFSFWYNRLIDSGGWERVFSISDTVAGDVQFQITNADVIMLSVVDTATSDVCYSTTTETTNTAEWMYLTGTFDGQYLKVYKNGVLKQNTNCGVITPRVSSLPINFGRLLTIYDAEIKIDDVRFYNTDLTQSQINSMYTATEPTYTFGAEESSNTVPTVTANVSSPATVYQNTDWLINMTTTDPDTGDNITGYVNFYVNTTFIGFYSSAMVNNTNTLVATLESSNFTVGDNLTAETWAGDGTVNTSKVNLTVTVSEIIGFTVYLNSPANETITNDDTPDFNFTAINNESNYSCELFLDNIGYGINETTLDSVPTIITANASLSDGTYDWYVNCTADSTVNQSEIRKINIGQINITTCQELNIANIKYILQNNITSTGNCLNITAENITVNGNGYNITFNTGATNNVVGIINSRQVIYDNTPDINFARFYQGYNGFVLKNITIISGGSADQRNDFIVSSGNNSIFENINIIYDTAIYSSGIFITNNSYNVTIINITIDQTNDISTSNNHYIWIRDSQNMSISNIDFTLKYHGTGFKVDRSLDIIVDNMIIFGNTTSAYDFTYVNLIHFKDSIGYLENLKLIYDNNIATNYGQHIIISNSIINVTNLTFSEPQKIYNYDWVSSSTDWQSNFIYRYNESTINWLNHSTDDEFILYNTTVWNSTNLRYNSSYNGILTVNDMTATIDFAAIKNVDSTTPETAGVFTTDGNGDASFTITVSGNTDISIEADVVPTRVDLVDPFNLSFSNTQTIGFNITPEDNAGFINCSILTNETGALIIEETDTSINNNITNTISHTFTSNGDFIWTAECYDSNSNYLTNGTTRIVSIDTVIPQVEFVSPTYGNNTNITNTYTYLNWTITEINQDSMIINWDDSNTTITNEYINKTGLSDETYAYYVWVNDTVGNSNQTKTRTLTIDTTDPITTINDTDSDWRNTTLQFSLSCDDGVGVGCMVTYYCKDLIGTCDPSTSYSVPVTVDTEGVSYVRYASIDYLSHIESIKTQTYRIDTIPPEITIITPENITYYDIDTIFLNYTLDDDSGTSWFSYNGGENLTFNRSYEITDLCYQEDDDTIPSCRNIDFGAHSLVDYYQYINYTNPTDSNNVTVLTVQHGLFEPYNITFPNSCSNRSIIELRLFSNYSSATQDGESYTQCYNGTWNTVGNISNNTFTIGSISADTFHDSNIHDGNWSTYLFFEYSTLDWFYYIENDTSNGPKSARWFEEGIWWNITYTKYNVSVTSTITLDEVSYHNITVWANDSIGNLNSSIVFFSLWNTSKIIKFTSGNYLDYAVTSYDGTFALIGQNDTTPGITVNNTGDINIDLNISVNMSQESCFSFWISDDATLNTSVDYNITNLINTTVLTNINITDNQFLWTWMIFDSCTVGNEYWYTDYYDSFAS